MKKQLLLIVVAMSALSLLEAKPVPTILSTDIGGDIDDTWALAHLLRSPELDLKMVLSETGDTTYRSIVSAKFLEVCDRADVVVAVGIEAGKMGDEDKHQEPWVKAYELADYPGTVRDDGVQAFIELVQATEGPINVIAVGPAPSLAAAIRQAPEIARKCNLFGMYGSFDVGYGGDDEVSAEYNVKADVASFRALMSGNWKSITITPLDTCGIVALDGENYHSIWRATDDVMMRAVIENYCIWAPRVPWMDCDFFTTRSSTLFDDVAVFMAYSKEFINYETIQFSVSDDGFTRRDPEGPFSAQIAITWKDLDAFEDHLTQRLLGKQ